MILELNGKKYEAMPDLGNIDCCVGCAFDIDNGCPNTDVPGDTRCSTHNIIWKEIKNMNKQNMVLSEPRYTVGEVLSARCSVLGTTPETSIQVREIAQYLVLHRDPEYKKYLELKAKFEIE